MKIYLTPEEIDSICKVVIQKGDSIDTLRDRFVIGCLTGLRFSDYSRINGEHIKDGFISILNKKTNKRTVIPVHPKVKQIFEKHKYEIPNGPTLRYYNMMLPMVGLKAKINQPVKHEWKADETVHSVMIPKHDLITTHTARRSFATNAYKAGIPAQSIMLITGHSTEESFFRYISISGEENANELSQHKFFQ